MTDILPAPHASDDSERLRQALNRQADQIIGTLDAAIKLRQAPPEAQRARHLARGHLVQFMLLAMYAASLRQSAEMPHEETL